MNGGAPITNPAATVRVFRILKIAFLVYTVLLLFIVIRIPSKSHRPVDQTLEMAITIVALATLAMGFVSPRLLAKFARPSSQSAPAAIPIRRWFTGGVIGLAFLEACSLFGLSLHFLGADLQHSASLVGAGIVAIVFFSPGALPRNEDGNSTQN